MLEEQTNTHYGTESGGFRAIHTFGGRSLGVECWGYWDEQTCAAFARVALTALERTGTASEFTLDAALLKPQSSAGQDALRGFLRRLAEKKPSKVDVRVSNVLTQMQLTRLLREAGVESVHFASRSSGAPPAPARAR
ncbi:MAG TPA: hypothetical protein VGM29_06320 [Polyangiaceae bacterium]|jgi:hypothetical protein